MLRLFSRLGRWLSSHSFYIVWTRSSAVFLILQGFFGGSSDFASIGLTAVLILLLISGVFLVVLGIKDLIRDFRSFLQSH